MTTPVHIQRRDELVVLGIIAAGLITICLAVVLGLFFDNNGLPNWAENVLVAISTAAALKLGDCISALVALATGRQVEQLGTQLGSSTPAKRPPPPVSEDVGAAAEAVADAASERADEIKDGAIPGPTFGKDTDR